MMLDPMSAPRMPRGKPLTPPASNMAPALRGADGGPSRCLVSPAGDGGSRGGVAAPARHPDTGAAGASLGPRLAFHQTDFRQLARVLEEEGLDDLDGAVFDLGVSSHQLDRGARGFSDPPG